MATNMDKALYQAPQGLSAVAPEAPDVEIEVEIDGMGAPEVEEAESGFGDNLAETLPDKVLTALASELKTDFDADLIARKEWLDTYTKGLRLLGLGYEERTEPWAGACGVFHPVLMEAAVKFQSETIMETFPAAGPVKTQIIGKETPAKKESATRVREDMNYELTEVMQEYRPEHERMLLGLVLAGNAFKKVYFDSALGRQAAPYVQAEDVVVPYGAANLDSATRVTHVMRKTKNEVRKLQVGGFYRDVEMGEPVKTLDNVEMRKAKEQGFSATVSDDRYQLLEMHVDLDLEGHEDVDEDGEETGIALPYIVTFERHTLMVLSVYRNWEEGDPKKIKRQHFVHYGYIPGFGFYYFGLIHLIGGHAQAATSLTRQLIDAGTLSNLPGGFKTRGMRIKGDDTPISPGEFRDVDIPSGALRDNMMPLPYKEPSLVLSGLLDKLVLDARRFAAVTDLNVSDMSAQAPVGTTLAILERVMKVMSAVQARIHYAMKQEFKLLAAIIRDNTPEDYTYEPEVGSRKAKRGDYALVDVLPVSDPNASTMSQKVVQYQAVLQLAQSAPQIYDLPVLHRQMIDVLGVKNAHKLVPTLEDRKPVDPVSENMAILMGKPVKAFQYQDHEAHLAVHMAAMRDPKMAAIVGQNPQAPVIMAAGAAHVMEHVAYAYRAQMEKELGAALPPVPSDDADAEDHTLPPEVEVRLSQLAARAAAQLLQKDQAEMAAQQAMQQQQDPVVQMQQQELGLKEKDLQRKVQKDMMDAAAKADELRIKEEALKQKGQVEGFRIGADTAKSQGQLAEQRRASMQQAAAPQPKKGGK